MDVPDLSGATLGQYRVEERLGQGPMAVVYRATQETSERPVALKVLDPSSASRPGFMQRCMNQTVTASKLQHPNILQVYEIGKRGQLNFLSMHLVDGGTLRDVLAKRRRLDVASVCRILQPIAQALHSAHEAGIVHQDLKPSNILIERDGAALVADFGLAPVYYGYAVGTPGYMSPEQAMGMEIDRRSDVHALGLMAFEMLTGSLPYSGDSPLDLILATVNDPVPLARAFNPDISDGVDDVLFRALAKDPGDRQRSVLQLIDELSQVIPNRRRAAAHSTPIPTWLAKVASGTAFNDRASGTRDADLQLMELINASPEPAIAIDQAFRVRHCNSGAEDLFGWSREDLIGEPVLNILVAPRYREVLERIFATYMNNPDHPQEVHNVNVVGLARDGTQVALKLSFSLIRLAPGQINLVVFCHDTSEQADTDRLRALQDTIADALSSNESDEVVARQLLEAVGTSLDWAAGAFWRVAAGGKVMQCQGYWQSAALEAADLEALTRAIRFEKGEGIPGGTWADGTAVWHGDFSKLARSDREQAALRAGLTSIGAFPVRHEDEIVGVLELFSTWPGQPSEARLAEMDAIGRRLGRHLQRSKPPVALATTAGPVRYKVDSRDSHLGFSCAFMKLMTVHGLFKDFSGWVELDDNDPTTARAECKIKTGSVDTGSQTRDYHLCSDDFFDVVNFPDIVFRSTGVEILGDERFQLRGDLTIRGTSRPITLDVRLEDRETDASGVERGRLTATAIINRSAWFLDWEKALQAGRWIVGEEVRLDLSLGVIHRPGAM
jgi:PAS domain S-box-containing protein